VGTPYAGGFGSDDLDNAGFAGNGDLTTVADPHFSRRRLSRSSNAQQSWLTGAASFLGSISLLARSAMVRQSSEYGAIAGASISTNTRKPPKETVDHLIRGFPKFPEA
jgi:hypothetical protein